MGDQQIVPRRFVADLPAAVPRTWLPGNAFVTAFLNTYTILVPANEAFYVRTFMHYLPALADPALHATALGFVRQEAQHGVAHRRYWSNLEAQGYCFRGFEGLVDRSTFRLVERIAPRSLRLSMVSCVEHINAYLGNEFLSQSILANADPRMRALMHWHFAEEVEHKSVAFDLLQAVAPGYGLRLLGCAIAAPLFYLVIGIGTLLLMATDRSLFERASWRAMSDHLFTRHHMFVRALRHLLDYLRPGFHPTQCDDRALAEAVLAEYAGREPAWLEPMAPQSDDAGRSPRCRLQA